MSQTQTVRKASPRELDPVRIDLAQAFNEHRAFPFYPDRNIIGALEAGADSETFTDQFTGIKNVIFHAVAANDATVEKRLKEDARLSGRVTEAVAEVHRCLAEIGNPKLPDRRFVIVKEASARPAFTETAQGAPQLIHVGDGPTWAEIPSIYLSLRLFDLAAYGRQQSDTSASTLTTELVRIGETEIENGFSLDARDENQKRDIEGQLLERITHLVSEKIGDYEEISAYPPVKPISQTLLRRIVRRLDYRVPGDALNFDHTACIKGITSLERAAKRYKQRGDPDSLHAIAGILVAASGHDIHEVRNRANIALERLYAPKEYDAPPATSFINVRVGQPHTFTFNLPHGKNTYVLRLYFSGSDSLPTERDIRKLEIDLAWDEEHGDYRSEYTFDSIGYCDFAVLERRGTRTSWVEERGANGRVNVCPDLRGEIILEVFPDIHGHTRVYWTAGDGHPGLVYNENGEVIRLGGFLDVEAHLEDLKDRYRITTLYLLGVQKRGTNREDWAPEATSPSPFSPVSLTDIEPSIGGAEAFRSLIDRAHELDVKVIVDIVPHVNRASKAVPDDWVVQCYDDTGRLVERASTDGRYGSWNDGKLLNYRKLAVWEWLADSVTSLVQEFDIDGIRFDTAHAVPIMMKKNNFPWIYGEERDPRSMVEGNIIVNDREDDHFITTGYYDSACRELIACPFYTFLMGRIARTLTAQGKTYFAAITECYWGRERFLARSGVMPYNSALFKICESIIHGGTDVREIYHLYDTYYANALPAGTQLIGILGNHDERRALNTFGHRGVRAAVALTSFMNGAILDYEGSAEGEAWKVFMDNIYVNWNQFEDASHRSLEPFYREMYSHHRSNPGDGHLLETDNAMVAAALKPVGHESWIGAFNFSDHTQTVSIRMDKHGLPIDNDGYYRITDPVYTAVTKQAGYYSGRELRATRIRTVVSYTDRIKMLKVTRLEEPEAHYEELLRDSIERSVTLDSVVRFQSSFAYQEIGRHLTSFDSLLLFLRDHVLPLFDGALERIEIPLKRILYHHAANRTADPAELMEYIDGLCGTEENRLCALGKRLQAHNQRGPFVFISAEADPFSKSGGLANVVYELPRELASRGEEVYVVTPLYRNGSEAAQNKMRRAVDRYRVTYTGRNVRFFIGPTEYEVGVHEANVDGVHFFLLDHYEFFDGLYWGYTGEERLRRRIALARSAAEVMCRFGIRPLFTFTNDAYTGVFNGIVRADTYYTNHEIFSRTAFFHIIHNGGWQYFDAYDRWESGRDLFSLFNLPDGAYNEFSDPEHWGRLNCMAAGIRFADRTFTVSPSYAHQLRIAGDGLERIITDIVGINNAIARDFAVRARRLVKETSFTETFHPRLVQRLQHEPLIKQIIETRYPEILQGPEAVRAIDSRRRREIVTRMHRKLMLQIRHGFDPNPDRILSTMLHRVTDQKGFNLLLEASEGIIRGLGVQLIAGGPVNWDDESSRTLAAGLENLSRLYPIDVSVTIGFQDVRLPLLGSDVFLMPSRHEPGGISQLEALAAGCLVVARATGGLRDTVFPLRTNGRRLEGNGILFTDFTAHGLYGAMERFHHAWSDMDEAARYDARRNAERSVHYWDRPARRYLQESYGFKEIIRPGI